MKPWLPITLLIIAVIVTVGVAFVVKNSYLPVTSLSSKSPSSGEPTDTAQLKLSLQPEITAVTVGGETAYDIVVDPGNFRVIGIQGYFDYNPQKLSVISVEPGTLLSQPDTLLNSVDPVAGKIAFALGSRTSSIGGGTIMKIRIRANRPDPENPYPLTFDQHKTHIAVEAPDRSMRYSEDNTFIVFEEKPLSISQ